MAKAKSTQPEVNFLEPDQVVQYMKDAVDETEWNERIDDVKAHYGGQFPAWWNAKIVSQNIIPKGSMPDIELSLLQSAAEAGDVDTEASDLSK